jgi:hypothetical protein
MSGPPQRLSAQAAQTAAPLATTLRASQRALPPVRWLEVQFAFRATHFSSPAFQALEITSSFLSSAQDSPLEHACAAGPASATPVSAGIQFSPRRHPPQRRDKSVQALEEGQASRRHTGVSLDWGRRAFAHFWREKRLPPYPSAAAPLRQLRRRALGQQAPQRVSVLDSAALHLLVSPQNAPHAWSAAWPRRAKRRRRAPRPRSARASSSCSRAPAWKPPKSARRAPREERRVRTPELLRRTEVKVLTQLTRACAPRRATSCSTAMTTPRSCASTAGPGAVPAGHRAPGAARHPRQPARQVWPPQGARGPRADALPALASAELAS